MRINENTDVNAFYLFPTKYELKLASNNQQMNMIWHQSTHILHCASCLLCILRICLPSNLVQCFLGQEFITSRQSLTMSM